MTNPSFTASIFICPCSNVHDSQLLQENISNAACVDISPACRPARSGCYQQGSNNSRRATKAVKSRFPTATRRQQIKGENQPEPGAAGRRGTHYVQVLPPTPSPSLQTLRLPKQTNKKISLTNLISQISSQTAMICQSTATLFRSPLYFALE